MDSHSSEFDIDPPDFENLSDSDSSELVEANDSFFDDAQQQPPEVIITMEPNAEAVSREQSQAISINRQETAHQSTISAESEISEIQEPLIFERVSDKILVKILQLVPREELDDLKDVSSQFRLLIDYQIGLSVVIGNMSDNWVDRVEKLKEIGVASCTVINLVNTRVPENPYRHPQLLHSLTLQGYISEKNFVRLVSTAPNIRKIQLDISTMSVVEFQDVNLDEYLPNLTILKVTSEGNFFADCTPTQWLTTCYSLIGLLEKTFQNLKQLNVSIPYISHFRNVDFDFTKTLFLCLQRHSSTLNRLKIEYGGFYEDFDEDDENNDDEVGYASFYSQGVSLTNLEYFAISLFIDDDEASLPQNPERWVQKLRQQWLPIINSQKKLQSCTVTHSIFFPALTLANVCLNNKQTLKVLHWKFQKHNGREGRINVDCIMFKDCSSLTELVLSGPTAEDLPFLGDDDDQSWWTRPIVKNLGRLPQSLEKLKLDFCEVAVTQFTSFPTEFPKLRCLSLDINCHDPWGISVDTLAGLLAKDSLKLLILQKSFNSLSLHNSSSLETTNPVASILKALISSWCRNAPWTALSSFALRRNINGQWENAGGAIPNIRRDMFPTPFPEGVRTLTVLPMPIPQRRVLFEI